MYINTNEFARYYGTMRNICEWFAEKIGEARGQDWQYEQNNKFVLLDYTNIDNLTQPEITETVTVQKQKEDCMVATSKLKKIKKISYRVRKDGLIEIRFRKNGKTISVYGHDQDEVIKKFKAWKPKVKKQVNKNEKKNILFPEWVETWINLYRKDKVSDNTILNINGAFKKHVYSVIGNKSIDKITTEDIQIILNGMRGILRQRTVVYNYLNQCLGKAHRTGKIKLNPCSEAEIKRVTTINEGIALTIYQQKILEKYCFDNPSRETLAYLVYLSTGMRPNELLTVNGISDIDRIKNTIHIKGTKTKLSNSVIKFPKQTIDLIPREEKPFNFSRDWMSGLFARLCKKLDFKNISLKSLRTTFATRCRENGVPPEIIQYYLRHTSMRTTSIYMKTQESHINNYVDTLPFNFTQNFTQKDSRNLILRQD